MSKKNQHKIRFVDIPELSETFADSIRSINFDGQAMKIELCVTRLDEPDPSGAPSARQYPSCRLVLSPNAAIDLSNKLQKIMAALEKSGAVKRNPLIPGGDPEVSH